MSLTHVIQSGNEDLISILPPDVLLRIALNLTYREIIRLCHVSMTFHELFCRGNYGYIWQQLYRRDISVVRIPANVTSLTEQQILKVLDSYPFKKTRFVEAVRRGYEKLAQTYLRQIDPKYRDMAIEAAFQGAAEFNYRDLLDWLFSFQPFHVEGAMQGAAKSGNVDLVNELLKTQRQTHPFSGVYDAAKANHRKLLDQLLAHGDELWIGVALEGAAEGNHPELVRELLNRSPRYDSALKGAARGGHWDLVKDLLRQGANRDYGLIGAAQGNQVDLVDYFYRHRANGPAFINAAEAGSLDVINYILTHRPRSVDGQILQVALEKAVQNGHFEIIKRLLQFDPNPKDVGILIGLARRYGYPEIAEFLEHWRQQHSR